MDDELEREPFAIPITDVFDLHSIPPRDVEAVVEEYLSEAHRLGLTAIRIVHGKGIGVQRQIVRSVFGRTPFVVASYPTIRDWEKRNRSFEKMAFAIQPDGSGVLLRRGR